MQRRKFLKNSSAATAGFITAPLMPSRKNENSSNELASTYNNRLKICLSHCYLHLEFLQCHSNFKRRWQFFRCR